jgi:hypothetical protein
MESDHSDGELVTGVDNDEFDNDEFYCLHDIERNVQLYFDAQGLEIAFSTHTMNFRSSVDEAVWRMNYAKKIIDEGGITSRSKATLVRMSHCAVRHAECATKHSMKISDFYNKYPNARAVLGMDWLNRSTEQQQQALDIQRETQRVLSSLQSIATVVELG